MTGYDVEPEDKFRIEGEEVGSVNLKPSGGDNTEDDPNQFDSITSTPATNENIAVDNLAEHVMSIMDMGGDSVKTDSSKKKRRKLTTDEANDLRSTKLLKSRSTLKKQITFNDFDFKMVLGRGTFGKVFLVELKENKKLYAIKSIRKDILIEYDQVESTMLEK